MQLKLFKSVDEIFAVVSVATRGRQLVKKPQGGLTLTENY